MSSSRSFFRLLLLSAAALLCAVAGAQSLVPRPAQTNDTVTVTTFPAPATRSAGNAVPEVKTLHLTPSQAKQLQMAQARNETCYTLHTYRFKQESPVSGAMKPDGEWTCTPAGQFQMKDATASPVGK